jgi:AICAR transformylase/IMP cyclohydrolase PurH
MNQREFEEWLEKTPLCVGNAYDCKLAWQAAQKAERERTTAIILKHMNRYPMPWDSCASEALEEINEAV